MQSALATKAISGHVKPPIALVARNRLGGKCGLHKSREAAIALVASVDYVIHTREARRASLPLLCPSPPLHDCPSPSSSPIDRSLTAAIWVWNGGWVEVAEVLVWVVQPTGRGGIEGGGGAQGIFPWAQFLRGIQRVHYAPSECHFKNIFFLMASWAGIVAPQEA